MFVEVFDPKQTDLYNYVWILNTSAKNEFQNHAFLKAYDSARIKHQFENLPLQHSETLVFLAPYKGFNKIAPPSVQNEKKGIFSAIKAYNQKGET